MAYNVLIVDDSSIIRKVLLKTFDLSGIPVGNYFQAENGAVGLQLLKENWVDIVFLDINMPVMNGIEFMRHVSNDEKLKVTPVVIVSTEGSKERKEELEQAGVKAYLRKPVSPEELVRTMKEVLGGGAQ